MHHVGAEGFLPGLRRITDGERAHIADQAVDAVERLGGAIDPALERDGIGDIDALPPGLSTAARELRHHSADRLGIAPADGDVRALSGKQLRNRAPDAFAATGHQHAFAGQPEIHDALPYGFTPVCELDHHGRRARHR